MQQIPEGLQHSPAAAAADIAPAVPPGRAAVPAVAAVRDQPGGAEAAGWTPPGADTHAQLALWVR